MKSISGHVFAARLEPWIFSSELIQSHRLAIALYLATYFIRAMREPGHREFRPSFASEFESFKIASFQFLPSDLDLIIPSIGIEDISVSCRAEIACFVHGRYRGLRTEEIPPFEDFHSVPSGSFDFHLPSSTQKQP